MLQKMLKMDGFFYFTIICFTSIYSYFTAENADVKVSLLNNCKFLIIK
jgi:hypothetical protein